jgi:hypothetical protein
MTSIEYLEKEYNENKGFLGSSNFEQALKMHKAEIIDAIINYDIQKADRDINFKSLEHGIKIENVDMAKMIFGEDEGSGEVELPQPKISDEEIEKGAINFCIKNIDEEIMHWHDIFISGANWYREQLKQKQNGNK